MISARRLFILLYTASGAAALVYEVTWTRLLTLQLGHTVAAASTVLAAFMGGLAVGAWFAGRLLAADAADTRNPLRLYAALEIVVAISALLLPIGLASSTPVLAWAYADGTAPLVFGLARVAISLALVGIPAAAMGATFPIAASWLVGHLSRGRTTPDPVTIADAGVLYAANTAGAAVGALAAGFWLIPALGLRATTWVGVALNVVAAGGALWISAHATTTHAKTAKFAKPDEPQPRKKGASRSSRPLREAVVMASPVLACVATAISGFSALVYEVAWTRVLALVLGPTTYAFATMAAAFIGGLAIGSALGTRLARRAARPALWLAAMLVAGAIAASAAAWFAATRMPLLVAAQVADPNAAFGRVILMQAASVAVLLLPMTAALGATFPLALAVASGSSSARGELVEPRAPKPVLGPFDKLRVALSNVEGRQAQDERHGIARDTAMVYTANTAGAIAGALVAGFLLVPQFGLRPTFQIAAIVAALTGAGVMFSGRRTKDGPRTKDQGPRPVLAPLAVAVVAVAAILLMPPWDRELLASGAYKYAPYLGSSDLDMVLRAGTLEYYKEGAAATVTVRRLTGTRSLAIDGKVDASDGGDMLTQRLLGLLPVLIHGAAEDVCVIGLGSGVTVGSALAPGTVRHADVIEISPEVVEASHFFDRENGAVLARPDVRLIVGDGRSHLLLTPRRYDVIVSEPSNPWMAGVSALFTREFFQAARARLKPNGLLCQWAHTYDISPDDLRSIVRTFASVFPQGTMWLIGEGDLLLIGATGDAIAPRLAAVPAGCRKGATAATLATVSVDAAHAAFSLLSLYAGGPRELARYGDEAILQTDDRLPLEYSAPRGIYGRTTTDNGAAIRALGGAAPPAVQAAVDEATSASWTSRGSMLAKAEAHGLAYDAFRRALTLDSRNAAALTGLSDAAAAAHREAEERQWLRDLAAREPANAAVRVELARVLASAGDFDAAVDAATEALRIAPDDPVAGEQLASVIADAGDGDRLAPIADSLAARFPDRPDSLYYRATALFLSGRTEDALAAARAVVAAHPGHARAQNLLGAACATLSRRDCAQAAFEASLRANPRDPSTYVNLGTFWLQGGNARAAANYFAEALAIDPQSPAAKNGLAQARAQALADPR